MKSASRTTTATLCLHLHKERWRRRQFDGAARWCSVDVALVSTSKPPHSHKISNPFDMADAMQMFVNVCSHSVRLNAQNAIYPTDSQQQQQRFLLQQMIAYSYDGRLNFSYDHAARQSVAQHSLTETKVKLRILFLTPQFQRNKKKCFGFK